ncbi:ribonuclease T2 [Roseovarius salinarum]|uniref:ribonuclease T2 n=1 Tax=Roseovarius salinarum TaxID=1981892 RepID=UPI001E2BAC64|nr:ribonuclease T2 [Roseovarius salinarum]
MPSSPLPRLTLALALLLVLAVRPADAQDTPGAFDYYVLALSWQPSWCALEGDDRDAPACARGTGHGWLLHGLWPQYHRGWPAYCDSARRPPSRAMTRAMADIMGSAGLAWHQWKKHGTCSGLPPAEYFALSRRAYRAVTRPEVLRKLDRPVRLPAQVIEAAFLKANPDLARDAVTITCRGGRIHEARICLSRGLSPVPCGRDVVTDCRLEGALLAPLR